MSETAARTTQHCVILGGSARERQRPRPLAAARRSRSAPVPDPEASHRGPVLIDQPRLEHHRSLLVAPRKILLAKSDANEVVLLKELLAAEGFQLRVTRNAERMVALARQDRPDLILIDNGASAFDGLAVARQLADDQRTCFVPVLLLCRTDDLCLGMWDGALDSVDFLRKPCSPIELRARIEKSLSQAETKRRLRLTASVDELTGIGNLRCLHERLASEHSLRERHGTPMAMMMIDVDKLKDINDRHGHSVGSDVLKAVATTLRSEIRESDTAVRYGGDEFVVMLPHTPLAAGSVFARRVLGHARQIRPQGVSVSLSIGIAAWEIEQIGNGSVDELLAHADSAAYRAKRSGGNQICVYDVAMDRSS